MSLDLRERINQRIKAIEIETQHAEILAHKKCLMDIYDYFDKLIKKNNKWCVVDWEEADKIVRKCDLIYPKKLPSADYFIKELCNTGYFSQENKNGETYICINKAFDF